MTVAMTTITAAQAEPQWSGAGKIRLIVDVPPVDLKDRKDDTLVASYPIDFDKLLSEQGASGSVDLSTLQVHQLDAAGKPVPFPKFDGARSEYDRPARFEHGYSPTARSPKGRCASPVARRRAEAICR